MVQGDCSKQSKVLLQSKVHGRAKIDKELEF